MNDRAALVCLTAGLIALVLSVVGVDRLGRKWPQSVSWESSARLCGRILTQTAWIYTLFVVYTECWRWYQTPKIASFAWMTALLLALTWQMRDRAHAPRSPYLLPCGFLASVMAGMCFLSVNMAVGWEALMTTIPAMVYMILIGFTVRDSRDFHLVAVSIGAMSIVISTFGLASKWGLDLGSMYSPGRAVEFTGGEDYTSETLAILLPINLCMCAASGRLGRLFYGIASIEILTLFHFMDYTPAKVAVAVSLLAMVPVIVFYRVVPRMARWRMLRGFTAPGMQRAVRTALVVMVLLGAVASAGLMSTDNSLRTSIMTSVSWIDADGDSKPDARPPMIFLLQGMDSAIRKIVDVFPLGVGGGNYQIVHPLYESPLERKVLGRETLGRRVHNEFLRYASEYGVAGMFGFVWMLCVMFALAFRTFSVVHGAETAGAPTRQDARLNREECVFYFYLMLGCTGAIVAGLVCACRSNTLWIPGSMVLFFLIAGVAGSIHRRVRYYGSS